MNSLNKKKKTVYFPRHLRPSFATVGSQYRGQTRITQGFPLFVVPVRLKLSDDEKKRGSPTVVVYSRGHDFRRLSESRLDLTGSSVLDWTAVGEWEGLLSRGLTWRTNEPESATETNYFRTRSFVYRYIGEYIDRFSHL